MTRGIEHIPDQPQQTIEELLPAYYEANGESLTYRVVRSIPVDGHDVAWAEYTGEVVLDVTGQGREGEPFSGHTLVCACEFTEGIGWKVEDGKRYSLDGKEKCLPRQAALYLRRLELRREYLARFESDSPLYDGTHIQKKNVPAIILDLIEKEKAGEFVGEDSGGASFWGGHFYLQTVAAITEISMKDLWPIAGRMIDDKQIGIEGAVIQTYYEPPAPTWEEFGRIECDGWTGVASLPAHSKMPQEWHFTLYDENGDKVTIDIPNEQLTHNSVFGPDADDVAKAESRMRELIAQAKSCR